MRHIHFWRSTTPRPLRLSISSTASYQEIKKNVGCKQNNRTTSLLRRFIYWNLKNKPMLNDETNQRPHAAEPKHLKEEHTALRPQQINSNRCPEQELHPSKSPNQPHSSTIQTSNTLSSPRNKEWDTISMNDQWYAWKPLDQVRWKK